MKIIVTYLFILLVSFSCVTGHHIEKRRYRKGFFVQWNNKVKETPQNETKSAKKTDKNINNPELNDVIYVKDIENSSILTEDKDRFKGSKKETNNRIKKVVFTSKSSHLPSENRVKLTNNIATSSSIVKQLTDSWMYLFATIITALTSWLFVFKREKSKKISKWASKNPNKAIAAIVSLKIALAFGALHFGSWLFGEGLSFSSSTLTTFFSLFLISSALYPHKRKRKGLFKQGYVRQKLHDISIVSLGTMMLMSIGNLSSQDVSFAPPLNSFISSTSLYDNMPIEESDSIQEDDDKIVLKIALSLLAVIVFVSLLYLIAILTCLLACNGQEAWAIGVFVFGLFGVIMLLVTVLKAIWSAGSPNEKGLNPEL